MRNIIYLTMLFACIIAGCSKDADTPPTQDPVITGGKYMLDNQLFNCKCIDDGQNNVFLKDRDNADNIFIIDRMPSGNTGTFNFGKSFTGDNVLPSGFLLESRSLYSGYGTESGTITKTSARSFTFQCTLYNPTKTVKYQISGNGNY